jgi:hypothetical protein
MITGWGRELTARRSANFPNHYLTPSKEKIAQHCIQIDGRLDKHAHVTVDVIEGEGTFLLA